MSLPARFPISAAEIDRVVAKFYGLVRGHPDLGPIFSLRIQNWETHEIKIAEFWRNAILFERGYNGNPMQTHLGAGNVKPEHFDPWLEMFDQVLVQELPAVTATAWSALAHRIGRGLRFGLENYSSDIPKLSLT